MLYMGMRKISRHILFPVLSAAVVTASIFAGIKGVLLWTNYSNNHNVQYTRSDHTRVFRRMTGLSDYRVLELGPCGESQVSQGTIGRHQNTWKDETGDGVVNWMAGLYKADEEGNRTPKMFKREDFGRNNRVFLEGDKLIRDEKKEFGLPEREKRFGCNFR
jgi:hypothetical protein